MEYVGKNIIITGGTGGICTEFAREFLRQGAENVGLLDIADPNNVTTALQSEFSEKTISYYTVDVRDRDQLKNAFSEFVEKFGHVDIVIGGAGILDEFKQEDTIAINLMGIINTTYEAIEWMSISKNGRGGLIVNISSIAGIRFSTHVPIYCASKHGVLGFTKSMANEINKKLHGIDFLTICPGMTETPMPRSNVQERITPDFAEYTLKLYATMVPQTPAELATNVCRILKTGKNGSIWVIHGNKAWEYNPNTYSL